MLNEILHFMQYQELSLSSQFPKLPLYTSIKYSDTTQDTFLTWICDVLLTQLKSVPPVTYEYIGVSLEFRPIPILGEDVSLIGSTGYPCNHQYTCFL